MSIGFAPNVENYGLENTGVKVTDRGAIDIDDYMRTNVPHIYAIGDVTAKLQLAHVAEAQGVVAAETIGKAETMTLGDYRMMPRATFCSPQVASFGLTEQQARDAGYDVKVAKFPFSANGKANGLGEPIGFVKLIADGEHLELLGGHLIGPDVSELLPELTLAQKWDLTALEAARNVHTHPTLSEAVQGHPRSRRPHDQPVAPRLPPTGTGPGDSRIRAGISCAHDEAGGRGGRGHFARTRRRSAGLHVSPAERRTREPRGGVLRRRLADRDHRSRDEHSRGGLRVPAGGDRDRHPRLQLLSRRPRRESRLARRRAGSLGGNDGRPAACNAGREGDPWPLRDARMVVGRRCDAGLRRPAP